MSKKEIAKRIIELEKEGNFNAHITLHENMKSKEIKPDYKYIRKSVPAFFSKIISSVCALLGGFIFNNFIFRLKINGKENLKNIKSAIITCNHINAMDNCMVRKATGIRKLYITAAEFNNFKSFLGFLVRNGRVLHFPSNFSAKKNFYRAVAELLENNKYVMFYPEGTLWLMYEKPRPLLRGAFNFSVQNKVPVIPMLITFKKNVKNNKIKRVVLNILEPLYPDLNLPPPEAAKKLQSENYQAWVKKYEEFYGKKLEYTCGDKLLEERLKNDSV